jgi:5-formyltetrahydrofolate cyclo-ligase
VRPSEDVDPAWPPEAPRGSGGAPKRDVRLALKQARAACSAAQRAQASSAACALLLESPWFEASPAGAVVALYAAIRDEADPGAAEAPLLARGLRLAYPRVEGLDLHFHLATRADLAPRPPWGLLEPSADAPLASLDQLALMVVPGLGFTARGERLGNGRGFYDRALARARAVNPGLLSVGFALAVQVVPTLPVEPHDQRVDAVVTERGLTRCPPVRGDPKIEDPGAEG